MAEKRYIYNCPFCDKRYVATDPNKRASAKTSLYGHMEDEHSGMLGDMSPAQVYFNHKYNKTHGSCVMCKKDTKWNEEAERYERFCSERCKEAYRAEFLKRMEKRPDWNLNDPEVQKNMLSHRKISGEYKWRDNKTKTPYVGSYEKDFLEFLDVVMEYDPKDVMSPAPQVFEYTYENKKHFYIPDFYLTSLNLVVEIKDGGSNPNTHPKIQAVDKAKEKAKDDVMAKQKGVYYIKVTDKDYSIFLNKLLALKYST
jgi:endogenous inhibitor of DNA gyrase (YacG/DUF329 family)